MRILVNNKIKRLFSCVLIFFILFTAVSVICVSLRVHYAVYCVLLSSLAMGIAVFASIYLYFRDQNKIMEDAVSQIKDYISGDRNARIECDDEGELYRLFHEVNSLVSILNAQAERSSEYLRHRKFDFYKSRMMMIYWKSNDSLINSCVLKMIFGLRKRIVIMQR